MHTYEDLKSVVDVNDDHLQLKFNLDGRRNLEVESLGEETANLSDEAGAKYITKGRNE